MDRYPYTKPPKWWGPKPHRLWIHFWRPVRRFQQRHDHRIMHIDVQGLDYAKQAMRAGQGVLITPNHAGHADCFLLMEALLRLPGPSYIMTAWQVFQMMRPWQQAAYRRHGCFSVDREGHDIRAFRQAVKILATTSRPLVIFPEGEVYHLNDRAMPFRDGTLMIAAAAVRRGGRPVACLPCALKYHYVDDPSPQLAPVVARLETRLGAAACPSDDLGQRVERLLEYALRWREHQYLGHVASGPLDQRRDRLADHILGRLEKRHGLVPAEASLPERVTSLRQHLIADADKPLREQSAPAKRNRDLDDVFVAVQLYSYAFGYVTESPTIERIAETVDKLEEDVLGAQSATIRGKRRGTVVFGSPLVVNGDADRTVCQRLSDELRSRVQCLLDELQHS